MNSDAIVDTQRRLRPRIDAARNFDAIQGAADLAAHLLLYLDDSEHCWRLTLHWLRSLLDADRVDGGFTDRQEALYRPTVEEIRQDICIPSSVGLVIDAHQSALREVLHSQSPVLYHSVEEDRRFAGSLRHQMLSLDTQSKLAVSLHDGQSAIGVICCDWTRPHPRWHAAQCFQLGQFTTSVLSPIFSAVNDILEPSIQPIDGEEIKLTATELKVARLVVRGLSYKEIAFELDRSFSTVDHCLRNIRDKLGARSTARMVGMLAQLLNSRYS